MARPAGQGPNSLRTPCSLLCPVTPRRAARSARQTNSTAAAVLGTKDYMVYVCVQAEIILPAALQSSSNATDYTTAPNLCANGGCML